jgi:hypothetical protein
VNRTGTNDAMQISKAHLPYEIACVTVPGTWLVVNARGSVDLTPDDTRTAIDVSECQQDASAAL